MSLPKAIGGYFELELSAARAFPHDDGILLQSARACFEYILRVQQATHVYLPYYACDVMLEPLKRLDIAYTFYAITDQLELREKRTLGSGEFLVYTNYFGVKNDYSRQLAMEYGSQLILDCSQAFFFDPPKECHTFYSPRKFFGVPDGGILYTDRKIADILPQDVSLDRTAHLLQRIEYGPEGGYAAFKTDDEALSDVPLSRMSRLTQRLLASIDYETAAQQRRANAAALHTALSERNKLHIHLDDSCVPMVYPYLATDGTIRKRLVAERIFVATYWPNVLEWCQPEDTEYYLAAHLLPLPIDQRYDKQDMQRIMECIDGKTD